MNNEIFVTVRDSTENLFDNNSGNFFRISLIFLHHFIDLFKKFLSITELHHHKKVTFILKNFKQSDDIGMVQILHNRDLNLQLFFHFRAHILFINYLHSSLFILTLLSAFVNFTISSLTNCCIAVDNIIVTNRDSIMLRDKNSRIHYNIFFLFNGAMLEVTETLSA